VEAFCNVRSDDWPLKRAYASRCLGSCNMARASRLHRTRCGVGPDSSHTLLSEQALARDGFWRSEFIEQHPHIDRQNTNGIAVIVRLGGRAEKPVILYHYSGC
jgi:hypothetical protein